MHMCASVRACACVHARACMLDVFAIDDNNISPMPMTIIKIGILYLIQIRHSDDFPSTSIRLVHTSMHAHMHTNACIHAYTCIHTYMRAHTAGTYECMHT